MVKIKITGRVKSDGSVYEVGDVAEVSEERAAELIEAGAAKPYKKVIVIEGTAGDDVSEEEVGEEADAVTLDEKMSRKELENVASSIGIDPSQYSNKTKLISAIEEAKTSEPVEEEEPAEE